MSARIVTPSAIDPLTLWGAALTQFCLDGCTVGVNAANTSGASPPALALSGSLTFAANMPGIRFACTVSGASPTFQYSADNGTNIIATITPTVGVPFALTGALAGLFVTAPAGAYLNTQIWRWGAESWTDLSGNGNHFLQTGTAAPLVDATPSSLGGRPSLTFATSRWYEAASLSVALPNTSILILKQVAWTSARNVMAGTAGVLRQVLQQTNSTPELAMTNGAAATNFNSGAAVGAWARVATIWTGSNSDCLKAGGVFTGGLDNTGTVTGSGVRLGTNASASSFPNISASCSLRLNRKWTAYEQMCFNLWAAARWGGSLVL